MKLIDLYEKFKVGRIVKDAEFSVFDKIDNLIQDKSVVFLNQKQYISKIDNKLISSILCSNDVYEQLESTFDGGIWVVDNPKDIFYQCHEYLVSTDFYNKPFENLISSSAKISPKAIISEHSVIIESGCVIEDNVIIKAFTKIGKNSIIRSNSDIGSDGFEVTRIDDRLKVVKHGGEIVIGENVEIQSLITISRGLFPTRNTIIDDNVKIADMVHIAHGVQIGKDTMIAAGVTISGNVSIGRNVWIGPGAIISNRLKIGDYSDISIGAVVVRNVKKSEKITGNLAINHKKYLKFIIKNKLI
ncbi:MAG: UDP-3-O-(3-hydroxymyristoyl)glucosamine N-acyltransferase [Candidatus Cloacimonetes bacterium]|nr:UDP-3-O-(3-hydroxymyristoyl)glucosamine N-acyltransferase [Candidatus Cloacimonadota bacterium]